MSGQAAIPRRNRYASADDHDPQARRLPHDALRKRSLSPEASHDERPSRRRRSRSPAERNRRSDREHYTSRSRSAARKNGPKWIRSERSPAERGQRRQRDRSRSRSRALTTRRRRSYSRSSSPPRRKLRSVSPPHRRRKSHSRSSSPPPRRRRSRSRSGSPPRKKRRSYSTSASPPRLKQRDDNGDRPSLRSRKPLPSQQDSYSADPTTDVAPPAPKEKVNWKTTGALAAETNTVQISANEKIVLKYNEPPDARKPPPSAQWRLYIFKGDESMGDVQLSTQSCWLMGREAKVGDLLVEHPSCSKQHAVIQFRFVTKKHEKKEMGVDDFLAEFGDDAGGGGKVKEKGKVRPYLLDLESANGTLLNGERIEPKRFVELREKDVIKFGLSEREYVLLKE